MTCFPRESVIGTEMERGQGEGTEGLHAQGGVEGSSFQSPQNTRSFHPQHTAQLRHRGARSRLATHRRPPLLQLSWENGSQGERAASGGP